MDEDSDFRGVVATLEHTPGGASVVELPFPAWVVEWTAAVVVVAVIAFVGLGIREVAHRVVDIQKRVR